MNTYMGHRSAGRLMEPNLGLKMCSVDRVRQRSNLTGGRAKIQRRRMRGERSSLSEPKLWSAVPVQAEVEAGGLTTFERTADADGLPSGRRRKRTGD